MKTANVTTAVTTMINAEVANGDLDKAPLNIPQLAGIITTQLAAANIESAQHSIDVATANAIAADIGKL